jgi:hypothetical protein
MAWMVLKWSIFKIVSGDPDLHPRYPPSAEIVLTHLEFPIGKQFTILVQAHPMIIPAKSQFNWPGGF